MMSPAFQCLRRQRIAHLGLELQEYEHVVSGARHIHLACEHPEHVFLVGFRTMPMDSSGVAHVLEHTSLCGSERFPVRDPFFMMDRRSLNTFMNAFTAGDWTAYPFATQNEQDFFNLFDVYMDAVFHPRLDPLDFAQEGIRVEWETLPSGERQLVHKGVVFNEMKGAMSAASSFFYEAMNRYLFPSTTYHYNSGGDPACIPQLTHQDLLRFHAEHYHPGNAVFMTFGQLPVERLQERMQAVLQDYADRGQRVFGRDEQRYAAPVRVEEAYPVQESDLSQKSATVLGWLLGSSFDMSHHLDMSLLTRLLLGHAAAPLRYALESSELGLAPSELCGLQKESRELVFIAGLEGSEPEYAAAIEALILDVLEKVAQTGFDRDSIEAALHRMEFRSRLLGGDGFPYGLGLMLKLLPAALQDADVLPFLDMDAAMADLRRRSEAADYIPQLLRRHFLDNPHRVRLTLRADAQYTQRAEAIERALLDKKAAVLDASAAAAIDEAAEALRRRQEQKDDADLLPCIRRSDIPACPSPEAELEQRVWPGGLQVLTGTAASNGIVDQRLLIAMPEFSAELRPWLSIYMSLLSELGAGSRDYLQQQQRLNAYTGGISAGPFLASARDNLDTLHACMVIEGRALARHQGALTEILFEQFEQLRLDERQRLRECIEQMYESVRARPATSGHVLAKVQAGQEFSAQLTWMAASWAPESILFMRQLYEGLRSDPDRIDAAIAKLNEVHQSLLKQPRHLLWAGEAKDRPALDLSLRAHDHSQPWRLPQVQPQRRPSPQRQVWLAPTQVQFCVEAFPTVHAKHPDAHALSLLAPILRNTYLHRSLREQGGAYGGGAHASSAEGILYFYSYRDPRLQGSYDDFAKARRALLRDGVTVRQVEEALFPAIADMDKPGSPAGEVMSSALRRILSIDRAYREQVRAALLQVGPEDILRVAEQYLDERRARQVAIIAPAHEAEAREHGFAIESLL